MNGYTYKDFTIILVNEPIYTFGSVDNISKYTKHYFGKGGEECPTSKYGIRIFQNKKEIENCIVIASGGATEIKVNSSLLDDDKLLICCSDTVFCLKIPDLNLQWKIKADEATCFGIFKQAEGFIVHGEVQIVKIDKRGQLEWSFGGSDIFVCLDETYSFRLEYNGILLTDFSGVKYKIDFEGNLLWDTHK